MPHAPRPIDDVPNAAGCLALCLASTGAVALYVVGRVLGLAVLALLKP